MKRFLMVAMILSCVGLWGQNNISLPAGTSMRVKLETTLATFSSKMGDEFSA